jgi:hypothetical protein
MRPLNMRPLNMRPQNMRPQNMRPQNMRVVAAAVAASLLGVSALSGCSLMPGSQPTSPASTRPVQQPSPVSASSPSAAAAPAPCPAATPAGFSCAIRTRIAEVEDFLKTRPGMIGIVLRDRQSGAVWQNKYADSQIYMAPRRLGGSYSGHPPA